MNNRKIKSYIKTFFITIVVLNVVAFIPLLFHDFFVQFDPSLSQSYLNSPDYLNMEAYKLQKLKKEKKEDYKINVELARIYMRLNYYVLAENEYKEAIEKEKNKSFLYFELAQCYLIQKKYDEATTLIENLQFKNTANLINSKIKFYIELMNAYYHNEEYYKGYKIYNKIKKYYPDTKSIPKLINKMYYKIGLMLVDEYVISGKTEEAFDLLNELAQINDSNIINYKLGLLYFEQDPKKALEYFEKVYKSDYSIINFDLYKRLLENLQMDAYYRNDTVEMELYKLKLNRLDFNLNTKYIQDDDFTINILKSKTYRIYPIKIAIIDFEIRNNTNLNYNNLMLTLSYETNDEIKKEKTFKLLNSKNQPIKANETSKKITLREVYFIDSEKGYEEYNEHKIKIYLNKNKKIEKTLIGTITLS